MADWSPTISSGALEPLQGIAPPGSLPPLSPPGKASAPVSRTFTPQAPLVGPSAPPAKLSVPVNQSTSTAVPSFKGDRALLEKYVTPAHFQMALVVCLTLVSFVIVKRMIGYFALRSASGTADAKEIYTDWEQSFFALTIRHAEAMETARIVDYKTAKELETAFLSDGRILEAMRDGMARRITVVSGDVVYASGDNGRFLPGVHRSDSGYRFSNYLRDNAPSGWMLGLVHVGSKIARRMVFRIGAALRTS